MTVYRNIPMTDYTSAVQEGDNWRVTFGNGEERVISNYIFRGGIHKDVDLSACEVIDEA